MPYPGQRNRHCNPSRRGQTARTFPGQEQASPARGTPDLAPLRRRRNKSD
jgi:hypothetical protein